MIPWLPWIAIVLAAGAACVRFGLGQDRPTAAGIWATIRDDLPSLIALALICAAAAYAGIRWGKALDGLLPSSLGLCLGVAAVAIAGKLATGGGREPWGIAISLAIPTSFLGMTHWFKTPAAIPHVQLGLAVGAMVAAFVLGIGESRGGARASCVAAVFLAVIACCDYLGRVAGGRQVAMTGLALGLACSFAALAAALIASGGGKREPRLREAPWIVLCLLLAAAAGAFLGRKFLSVGDVTLLFVASLLLGAVVHWFMPDDDSRGLRFALAVALWLAVGVEAYTRKRGFGMSICLVGGAAASMLLGNRRALLALGPLAALTLYRIFHECYPEASRALDVNPHYAMIGVFAGAVLPLIALEWLEGSSSAMLGRGLWAAVVWVALLLGVPIAGVILLGPKGAAGYLAGLGLVSVVAALKGSKSLTALTVPIGLGATMAIAFGWLSHVGDMTRDDRAALLGRILVDVIALGVLLTLLSRRRKEEGVA